MLELNKSIFFGGEEMLKNVLIIANPVAGKAKGKEFAIELASVLEEAHQSQTEIKYTEGANDATNWANESVQEGYDSVFCLGGDGTVSEVIEGLMSNEVEERPYFSFVPLGTVNDLARAIGIPLNPQKAIDSFKNIQESTLDVGQINDSYFINVIAIGVIPEGVMNTQSDDKNRLGVFAYIKDGLQGFFSHKGYDLKLTIENEEERKIKTNLMIVALTNSVGGLDFMFNQATYNDGLLHLAAVDGHHPISTINAALELSFDNLTQNDLENMVSLQATQLDIESLSEQDIATNMDGDPGPNLPVSLKVIHNALKILLPKF